MRSPRQRGAARRGSPLAALAAGLALAAFAGAAAGQTPAAPAEEARPAPRERFADPWDAYRAGAFDRALEGFVDLQVERPEDPVAALNLGSAQYKVGDYPAAERSFASVAAAAPEDLRAEALYNLGNCAYRQGRLAEAVDLYRAALEIDPDDQDAKYNLEFVRNEIRRRHEEAEKRRQEQQQQQDQQQAQQPERLPGERQEEPAGGGERPEPDAETPPESASDRDGDGLPDELERSAENPTDPANPDSDGDGLRDGEEDLDRDGRVGPGETDPNNPDSDGDGVPDGAEAGRAAEAQATEEGLTPEEAARYLQALEEGRPAQRQRAPGSRRRPLKDW